MALLVEAFERCRGPEDAAAPSLDRAGFKELVRELDLWCSSSMVALEDRAPVGVLLGAKRPAATLVYGLRVHPEHRRRGHGRHLLTSLGQKLAILGPPRLVAEVPADRAPARALFAACRWREEGRLVDWRRTGEGAPPSPAGGPGPLHGLAVGPMALEEVLASGLVRDVPRCWRRDPRALETRREGVLGLGFCSPERLEAVLLYRAGPGAWEILALGGSGSELGRAGLRALLEELARRAGGAPLELARAAPEEVDSRLLAELGFRAGAEHLRFAGDAQSA